MTGGAVNKRGAARVMAAAILSAAMTSAMGTETFAAAYQKTVVVQGTEKPWLFFDANDGQPMETYQRTNLFTEEEMKKIGGSIGSLAADLNAEGIKFIFMIVPDKEEVYGPEYLPESYTVADNEGCTMQLIHYMNEQYPDIPIVYPLDEMNAAKDEFEGVESLYYKSDTHWNLAGAYVGTRALMEQISKDLDEGSSSPSQRGLEKKTFVENGTYRGDLQKMGGLGDDYTSIDYYPAEGFTYENYDAVKLENDIPFRKTVSRLENPVQGNVWVVGDSFRGGIAEYLAETMERTTIVNRYYFDPDTALQDHPDIFVYEIAERYLHQAGSIPGYNRVALNLPR
jgi:hypothetical protein